MSQDDELTLSRLLAYRQLLEDIVAARGGRMFGVAGDSWMAEFPCTVEAVRCADDCQRSIDSRNDELPEGKRIRFRIGIHVGHALADLGNLFGDAVNIAARLQQICRPGCIVISDAVFQHVRDAAGLRFAALGVQRLKNISEAISAYTAGAVEAEGTSPPRYVSTGADISKPVPGFAGKPAIAVLPFRTLGGRTGDNYLGEGFAEDLVNGLSNLRWFPVIARRSSFVFNNHDLDTASIGRALGASYLVMGSFRLTDEELRLVVHLIDAGNGRNLWSQKYQIKFNALFETQDEIIAGIVSVLEAEVERAEITRLSRRKTEDLNSWELVRRGVWHLYRLTREDAANCRTLLEEALRRDPGSSEARIQLAWWHFWDVWVKQGDRAGFSECERLGREAAAIDPRDARAHLLVGLGMMMTEQPAQSRLHFREAIDLNPSLATAHGCLGSSYVLGCEPEKGIEFLLLSNRLNPRDPFAFSFLGELAVGFHMLEDWPKACEFAERSLRVRPNFWYARAVYIASLARSGRIGEARRMAARFMPQASAARIAWVPFIDKKWACYLTDGLKLAGCQIT